MKRTTKRLLTEQEIAKAQEMDRRYRHLKAEPDYDHIFQIAAGKMKIHGLRRGDPDSSKSNLISVIMSHEFSDRDFEAWNIWMDSEKRRKARERVQDRRIEKLSSGTDPRLRGIIP